MLPRRALPLVALLAIAACDHPLRDRAIEELGDEADGVSVGPLHRPGQPCGVCHDGDYATGFSLAGTVYFREDKDIPATNAIVTLLDSGGKRFRAATNCAGNFFVQQGDFDPTYPVWVSIAQGDNVQTMESPIHVESSCSACHAEKLGPTSAGRVYLTFDGDPPADTCE